MAMIPPLGIATVVSICTHPRRFQADERESEWEGEWEWVECWGEDEEERGNAREDMG